MSNFLRRLYFALSTKVGPLVGKGGSGATASGAPPYERTARFRRDIADIEKGQDR